MGAQTTSKRVVRLMCLLTKTSNSVAMHMPHSARVNETEGETKRSMNNESQTWLHRRSQASSVGERQRQRLLRQSNQQATL